MQKLGFQTREKAFCIESLEQRSCFEKKKNRGVCMCVFVCGGGYVPFWACTHSLLEVLGGVLEPVSQSKEES